MGIFSFFKRGSKKEAAATVFLNQASVSIKALCEKAQNLTESYSEEKLLLKRIYDDIKAVEPDDNPTAIKFEHSILEKATLAGSLCDKAIIGKDSGEFKNAVQLLGNSVQQRRNFTSAE